MRLGLLLTAALTLPVPADTSLRAQPPAMGAELRLVGTYDCGKETVRALDHSTDGKRLAVAAGQELLVWDVATHQVVARWADPHGLIGHVAFTGLGAGATLFVYPQSSPILLSPVNCERLGGLDHGKEGIFGMAFDLPRRRIVTSTQRSLLLWEGTTLVREWKAEEGGWFRATTFSPDGRTVAVALNGGGVHLYSTEEGSEVKRFPKGPERNALRGFSFTMRGDELLIGDRDASRIRVVDVAGKRPDRFASWEHPPAAPKKSVVSRQSPPYGIETLAHTPDGSTVVVGCNDKTVRLYETLTWGLRHVAPVECFRVTFTPDSRHMVVATYKSGLLRQFDWRVLAKPADANDRIDLDRAWKDLASLDAAVAYQAMGLFARDEKAALPFLAAGVKPVRVTDEAAVRRYVEELGAPDFRKREAASASLAGLGVAAEPFLRGALTSSSPEVVARATRLLGPLTRGANTDRLRHARALELLEYFGTPAAVRVLQEAATGVAGLPETGEAAAALARVRVTQGR